MIKGRKLRTAVKLSKLEADALRVLVAAELDAAIWSAFWNKANAWAVALQLALILLPEQKIAISELLSFS